MEPKRWEQIKSVLHQAESLAPKDRSGFLLEACGADEVLLEEVRSLLAVDADRMTFLEHPLLKPESATLAPGSRIGPYQVVRELGSGGMGSVYLVDRTEGGYLRRVAVKVLKRGMHTREVLRRFQTERQIMANLMHPNIVTFFDDGSTREGLPFLVMEYVEGEPLHRYCQSRDLPIDARLKLFQKICAAVHFAHQNLVIHRDLKPANILVTADDEPKLLDFGIAKLLAPPDLTMPTVTIGSLRLMTPEYASPEQVRGGTITTASDVYTLGVLLFELLTGSRPYTLTGDTPEEIKRVICEQEPEKPSLAAKRTASGQAPTDPRGRRKRSGLRPGLRGDLNDDLDTIVLKALRKEPDRRYASAQQFAEDIDRYLKGFPVLAKKETMRYVAGKFVRRHRFAVGSCVLGFLLGIGMIVLMSIHQQKIRQEQQRTLREWQKSQRIYHFLIDLFKPADPFQEFNRGDLTARELLDTAVQKLQNSREMTRAPEIRANLLDALGVIYSHLGLVKEAVVLLEEALELRLTTLSEDHLDVAQSYANLGKLYLNGFGQVAKAETYFSKALQIRQRSFGENHPETILDLVHLAASLDRAQSEPMIDLALSLAERNYGPEHYRLAGSLREGGRLAKDQGNYPRSQRLLNRSLAILEGAADPNPLEIAITLESLGALETKLGNWPEAEVTLKRALELKQANLYHDHPLLPSTLANLAVLCSQMAEYEQSAAYHLRAIGIIEKSIGKDKAALTPPMSNLSALYSRMGKYAKAEELERAILASKQAAGFGELKLMTNSNNLGALCLFQHKFEEAEYYLNRALIMHLQIKGPDHPNLVPTQYNLAILYTGQERYAEAEHLLEAGLTIIAKTMGPEHPAAAKIMRALATVERHQSKWQEAASLLECALEIQQSKLGPDHPDLALTLLALAELAQDRGAHARAGTQYDQALVCARKAFPAGHPTIATILHGRAALHLTGNDPQQALPLCEQALNIREAALRPDHPDTIATMELCAKCFRALDQDSRAVDLETRAKIFSEIRRPGSAKAD